MNQPVLNFARKDKFLMVLDLPLELKQLYYLNDSKKNADPIQVSVIGSPVPAINIPQIELRHTGQSFHFSSHARPAYQPVDVNILIDNQFLNYWILWSWLNKFNEQLDGLVASQNIKNLITRFTIYALDEYNNRIMSFKYTDVFITGLSDLIYSYQDQEIITCKATFAYSRMLVDRIINSELDKETGDICLTS
jgi:hypothetical protein